MLFIKRRENTRQSGHASFLRDSALKGSTGGQTTSSLERTLRSTCDNTSRLVEIHDSFDCQEANGTTMSQHKILLANKQTGIR